MSRRVPSSHKRRQRGSSWSDNPYQGSTLPLAHSQSQIHHQPQCAVANRNHRQTNAPNIYRNSYMNPTTIETGFSDTDATYYEYYNDIPNNFGPESRNTDYTFSEDSGSVRLPLYDAEDGSSNQSSSRNVRLQRSSSHRRSHASRDSRLAPIVHNNRDSRRIYPQRDDIEWDRLYHEIPSSCDVPPVPKTLPRRVPNSPRPQSSQSSGVGGAVVDGCGGKCQTFENVCYFFLQLVFTMGILIGISLCIAGLVLRKSAARNLQVLVYIGVLVALVSTLLLAIQCNARRTAKNRKNALWNAKRAPIPMQTLQTRTVQQPLMVIQENGTQRILPFPQIPPGVHEAPPPQRRAENHDVDQQGIPWWRRKDLNN